jgi:hypothetical protein
MAFRSLGSALMHLCLHPDVLLGLGAFVATIVLVPNLDPLEFGVLTKRSHIYPAFADVLGSRPAHLFDGETTITHQRISENLEAVT